MTKVERVLAAINFQPVDRVPKGEFHLDDDFVTNLLGLKRAVEFTDRVEACKRCGIDALAFSPSPFTAAGTGGSANEDPSSNPSPNPAEYWQELKRWREETDFFLFALIDGPFQGSAKLFPSFTNYLLAIAQADPILPELVGQSTATNVDLGLKALASGAHGIIVADDVAYNGGTFVSPTALRMTFFPGLREEVAALKAAKVPVFFHADGDLKTVLPDILSSGVNGLHSLDFSSLSEIAEVRKAAENRVCLMGGYNLGWFEEEERLRWASDLLEAAAAKGSGYIFGSSAGILGKAQNPQSVLAVYGFVSEVANKNI